MLIAREFTKEDKNSLLDMIEEIKSFDNNFEGLTNISNIADYDDFLLNLEKYKHQELIEPEYSPQTTFGLFEDERLIGGFNLRHVIKGALINHGGNIGYLVRPSERRKGYGAKLLHLALEKAKEIGLERVLISCKVENIGSMKIIEKNSGVYESNYYEESTKNTFKRYWIDIERKLEESQFP